MATKVVFEHVFAVEGHVSKDFLGFAPAGFSFAGGAGGAAYDLAFEGDGDGTKTGVAFGCGVDSYEAGEGYGVAGFFAYLSQYALFDCFFVAYDAAGNGVAEAVGAVNEEEFAVLFDDGTSTQ